MLRLRVRWSILVLIASVAPASGQPADAVVRAEEAMQRGIAARDRGDHAAALTAFVEAAELAPDANIPHRLAGEALEALGRYFEAIDEYKRYLAIKPGAKGADEVRTRIDRIEREHVATIEVMCDPIGAVVELDGHAAGKTPLSPVRVIAPSRHQIVVSAEGRKKYEDAIDIKPGEHPTLQCVLDKLEVPIVIAPPPVRTGEAKPWYRKWTFLGPALGVAAVAVGTGVYLSTRGVPSSDGGAHAFP